MSAHSHTHHAYTHTHTVKDVTHYVQFTYDGKNITNWQFDATDGNVDNTMTMLAAFPSFYRRILRGEKMQWTGPSKNCTSMQNEVMFAIHCKYPHMEELLAAYAKYEQSTGQQIKLIEHARMYNPEALPILAKHLIPQPLECKYEYNDCTLMVNLKYHDKDIAYDLNITGKNSEGTIKCTEMAQWVVRVIDGACMHPDHDILQKVSAYKQACARIKNAHASTPTSTPAPADAPAPICADVHAPASAPAPVCTSTPASALTSTPMHAQATPSEKLQKFKVRYRDQEHTINLEGARLLSVQGPFGPSINDIYRTILAGTFDNSMVHQDLKSWWEVATHVNMAIASKMLWRDFDYTIGGVTHKVQFSRNRGSWACPTSLFTQTRGEFDTIRDGTWKPTCPCCTSPENVFGTRVFTWLHGKSPEWGNNIITQSEATELIADHKRWL